MKNARAIINFSKLSDADLESAALSIIDHMTDNSNFPTATPSLTDVTAAVTEYTSALSGAKNRGKAEVEIKKVKRTALIAVLTSLGNYVTFTANGDRTIIATSGFKITKDTTSPQTLGTPQKYTVTAGKSMGEALSVVGAVKGAKKYTHQYTPDPLSQASVWSSAFDSGRTYTFTGLDSGKKYWFRAAALGNNTQVEYTTPIALIIQ